MTHSLLSIIIPTYNAAESIGDTLQSIINQSYKDIEVIVLDAVSIDTTCKIVKGFKKEYPFIQLISEKDKGVYEAMNKGVKLAKGDYLYFMGGDDVFYNSNTLEKVFETVTKEQDFIYGNVLFKKSQKVYSGESSLQKLVYDQVSICHQAIFYSKRVFKMVGNYNLKYFIHADYDFNIRCFRNKELVIHYIDQIIAIFNETGLSSIQSNADGFHTDLTEKNPNEKYKLAKLFEENKKLVQEINQIKKSKTFRIGRFILAPLRLLRKFRK